MAIFNSAMARKAIKAGKVTPGTLAKFRKLKETGGISEADFAAAKKLFQKQSAPRKMVGPKGNVEKEVNVKKDQDRIGKGAKIIIEGMG